ncbi:MAG: PLP-dependent aminotransferase family protein, partial [Rhizomicrobium sp.]
MTEKTGADAKAKHRRSSGRRPPVEFFLAKDDSLPLHEQIYRRLRELITTGAFPNGKRLPSTRALAASLGVSRNSVLTAIGKLVADGWLKPARGSGIYVSYAGRKAGISEGAEVDESKVPFAWGWATDVFPADLWKRLQERHLRRAPNRWLEQGERVGLPQLRKAIANHLAVTRGVDCSPSRVIVTSSIPSGVDLAIAALGMVGRKAWVEDPLAHPPKEMLAAAGLHAIPVPVDRDGFAVGEALRRAPDAGMAIVSPACQGPMGFAMSRERRAALAEWAGTNKTWILE